MTPRVLGRTFTGAFPRPLPISRGQTRSCWCHRAFGSADFYGFGRQWHLGIQPNCLSGNTSPACKLSRRLPIASGGPSAPSAFTWVARSSIGTSGLASGIGRQAISYGRSKDLGCRLTFSPVYDQPGTSSYGQAHPSYRYGSSSPGPHLPVSPRRAPRAAATRPPRAFVRPTRSSPASPTRHFPGDLICH